CALYFGYEAWFAYW
nr:immunoglobulin heavy chain junction region [Mus musculus]